MSLNETNTVKLQSGSLIAVLVFAVLIRLLYQAGMLLFGGSFNNGSDSGAYLLAAHQLLTTGTFPETDRLPFYIYFLAGIYKIVGSESLRAAVTIQAFVDSL